MNFFKRINVTSKYQSGRVPKTLHTRAFYYSFLFLLSGFLYLPDLLQAQNCPPNIDFENGTFDGWTCYTGSVADVGGQNVISLSPSGPVYNRHTMYSANSGLTDQYGHFSVNCPNGSGHSIRLGNDLGGAEAEGVSYDFTIPAGRNVYSLIYYYAVVFQDPNHLQFQQPRMEVEVSNITDGTTISCSSFTFIPYGSLLPGFFESPNPGGDGTPVWCKDWSAVTINLNGMAGKTIRLFFKTADCTFRKHFGYAYIDVNSECSDEFVGASFCPDDTAVNVIAPYGYQNYNWFNNNFTQTIGTGQTLSLKPPPSTGTSIAVQLTPYSGYGCLDTLYAKLLDTLTVHANAGPDTVYCGYAPVQLGAPPKLGLVYTWSPANGLSNTETSNPLASPDSTTDYILTVRNSGGGCLTRDTVTVKSASLDKTMQLIGKASFCIDSEDSAVLKVNPADSIQWYKDGIAINTANQTRYRVYQSGSYYAVIYSKLGCVITTDTQTVFIDKPKLGINYPVQYAVINLPITLQARNIGVSALWSPATDLNNPASFNPVFKGATEQSYTIQLTAQSGCVTVDTQLVKTVKGVEVYVPTAFTPNGDGLNDILRPVLMGVKELHFFRIYNRWGQLLFQTNQNYSGWDGKVSGTPQPTEVVVWEAEVLGVDGRIYVRKGTTVLIR